MRTAFVDLPRPFVCALIAEKSIAETVTSMRRAEFAGAQALGVDIRFFQPEEKTAEKLAEMIHTTVRPVYAMHYRGDDGLTDDDRADYLLMLAQAGASIVDVMGDLFDKNDMELAQNEEAVAKQRELIGKIHATGASVVMSSHLKISRTTEEILAHLNELDRRGADVLKIVPFVNTEEEMLEAVRTTMTLNRTLKKPFIHVANGVYGRHQRSIAPMFGNMLSFGGYPSGGSALSPWFPVEVLRDLVDKVYDHMDTEINQNERG